MSGANGRIWPVLSENAARFLRGATSVVSGGPPISTRPPPAATLEPPDTPGFHGRREPSMRLYARLGVYRRSPSIAIVPPPPSLNQCRFAPVDLSLAIRAFQITARSLTATSTGSYTS